MRFPSALSVSRLALTRKITANRGIFKNEFHQDEKYFMCSSHRRKRKVEKTDKEGSEKADHSHHRRHQTHVMFTGCVGVGPDGEPVKVHFEWVSEDYTARANSKYHRKGDVYQKATTMDAKWLIAPA